MPQDFFADGFAEEQGIIFTKEEQDFLQKNLKHLKPTKHNQIPIGNVLSFLKYARLDHSSVMKILQNCCTNGIGQKIVTYDEMKRIFRGVALKQNKMEPSKINIEANIKTKMPVMYDDDDQQQPEQIPKTQQQTKPAQSNIQPTPTSQPPKVQQPVDPLKAFDEYWKNLKTKNNLIEGSQVKKLFSNNNLNKNNLSKAWKLCNISEKGSLTKGEFFIFINLINSNNIPQALTKQMKDFIVKIQTSCGYKKNQKQPGQRTSSSSVPNQKPKEKNPNDAFDKFGDQSLFAKNASKVQDFSKQPISKNSSKIFPASQNTLSSNLTDKSIVNVSSANMGKSALFLLQKVQNIANQQKSQQKNIENINVNNQQMIAGLQTISQYLQGVQKNMEASYSQIMSLKQTQQLLNQRLNNVCLKFRNIITKQAECINFMKQSIYEQSESNAARLQILQQYTEQMLMITESTMQENKSNVANLRYQQQSNFNKVNKSNQILMQKLNVPKRLEPIQSNRSPVVNQKVNSFQNSPVNQNYTVSDPFDDGREAQYQNHHYPQSHISETQQNDTNFAPRQEPPTNKIRVQDTSQKQQQQVQQGHIYLENLSPEQRKKTKQMLLIKILNSVSSMNEQEYAQVVSKVVAMTEEQMNQSYTKLHALYTQNINKNRNLPRYPVPTPEQFSASNS